ncbi:MAG: hypothetical protein H8D23_00440 [Candidatus Brocadiales bacterium]|nr:hypothetical protein [Candidatus Brocadiales bacterium]
MGIFKRKKKITVEEFCEIIFSEYIQMSPILGEEPWDIYCSSNHHLLSQRDPSFGDVSLNDFSDQMLALRLEVLGIASFIHFKDIFSPKINELTQSYLSEQDQENIWELMSVYNTAVAKSAVGGYDPKTPKGRGYITFINSMRTQLFDDWVKTVENPNNAARAANRVGCDQPWKVLRTHSYLTFAFTRQLGHEFNKDAMEHIVVIIQGLYEGFMIAIDEFKIAK